MQVYCVLIAQLLMVVIRKKAATKKSFANMIIVIRLHLMSYVALMEFIKDGTRPGGKHMTCQFRFQHENKGNYPDFETGTYRLKSLTGKCFS